MHRRRRPPPLRLLLSHTGIGVLRLRASSPAPEPASSRRASSPPRRHGGCQIRSSHLLLHLLASHIGVGTSSTGPADASSASLPAASSQRRSVTVLPLLQNPSLQAPPSSVSSGTCLLWRRLLRL
ncbi:hypothetical protein U9M48_000196 [Paspalum notatum var. saurae]|uniref:Uncharacterized protein n=1 Tax=Paspalum notatum var. saurae TaxID=547442 RepID=A0AAQ3PKZ9_PASNO